MSNNIFIELLPPWVETGIQPAFYDKESGTVLQQTARMYAKVNELIASYNQFAEHIDTTVDDYIERFNELYNYVHDYFDNLDVQEEINNKLDDMAEAGTLQDIITNYLQSNVAWTFDTVADMKVGANLTAGAYARTLGFHTINDGGGALYYITDSGTANEQDIISVNSTLYANLVLPSKVTPEIYGAYCDGTNNDGPAIQKAIDSGYPVLLSKNYYITQSIYIGNQDPSISGGYKKNLVIDGSKSTVTYTGGNSAFVIAGVQGGTLRFGTINASNGSCIEMWSTNGNVRIVYLDIYFNELRPSEKAIYVHANTGSSGTGFINQIKINGGTIYSGDYGIYVTSTNETNGDASGYTFNGVAFEGCDVCFYGGSTNGKLRGFTFNDIRYVENDSAPLFVFDGNIDNFYMRSWGRLYPSRIDMTNATVTQFRIDAPIADNQSSTTRGDGLYIDSGHIDWLSNRVSSKTLTNAENASGTIVLFNQNNQLYLSFVGVYGTTSTQTLVTAANSPCKPIRRLYGTLVSSAGTVFGRVSIETDGEIKLNTTNANVGTGLYGSLVFASYDKKYF